MVITATEIQVPEKEPSQDSGSLTVQVPRWSTLIPYPLSRLQKVVVLSCGIRKVLKFHKTAKLFPTLSYGFLTIL